MTGLALSPPEPGRLEPGGRLDGRYRIEARIGQGAHGSVYRAVDERDGSPVAIKHLHAAQRASPVGVARFEREAQYLLALSHPNIVRARAFGRADGAPYLVCELLEGASLRDVLKSAGALPLEIAATIALDVLSALAAAHAAGILHRDVKPGNIFVPPPGVAGPARVIDFGIARALERDGAVHLTLTGEAIGTPAYIAPEQAYGDDVRETADVYALGLTLAEMIGGERVVTGSSELSLVVLQASASPHVLNDRVRQSPLGWIVARAIEKRAAARFGSANEMAAAIRAALPASPPRTLMMTAATRQMTLVDAAPRVIARSPAGAPPRAPTKPSMLHGYGGWIAAAAGVAVAAGVAAVIATSESASGGRSRPLATARVASAPPRVDPAPPPTRLEPRHDAGFADIDADELDQRVRAAGYTIEAKTDFGAGTAVTFNVEIHARRGDGRATLTCTRYRDEAFAERVVGATEIDGFVARRDGAVVLTARVDDDASATRELLDDVASMGAPTP